MNRVDFIDSNGYSGLNPVLEDIVRDLRHEPHANRLQRYERLIKDPGKKQVAYCLWGSSYRNTDEVIINPGTLANGLGPQNLFLDEVKHSAYNLLNRQPITPDYISFAAPRLGQAALSISEYKQATTNLARHQLEQVARLGYTRVRIFGYSLGSQIGLRMAEIVANQDGVGADIELVSVAAADVPGLINGRRQLLAAATYKNASLDDVNQALGSSGAPTIEEAESGINPQQHPELSRQIGLARFLGSLTHPVNSVGVFSDILNSDTQDLLKTTSETARLRVGAGATSTLCPPALLIDAVADLDNVQTHIFENQNHAWGNNALLIAGFSAQPFDV